MRKSSKKNEPVKTAQQYLFKYLVDKKRKSGDWKKEFGGIEDEIGINRSLLYLWYKGERNIRDEYYDVLSKIFDTYVSIWRDVKEEYFIYNGWKEPIEEAHTLGALHFFTELGKYKFNSLHDCNYKKDKILDALYNIIYKEIPEIEGLAYKPLEFRKEKIFKKLLKKLTKPGDVLIPPNNLEYLIYDSIVELIRSGKINGKQPDYFGVDPQNLKSNHKLYPIDYDASQEFIEIDTLLKDEYEIYCLECKIECSKKYMRDLINELNERKEKPSKKSSNEYYFEGDIETLAYFIELYKKEIKKGECRLEEMKQKYEQKKKDCDLGTDQQSQSKTNK